MTFIYRSIALPVLFAVMLSGCAVAEAWKGRVGPDLGVVIAGASRREIESELGEPVASSPNMFGGTTDRYRYVPGTEPSAGRAAAYTFLDAVTLGIWELIAAPRKRLLDVEYDQEDTVVLVRKPPQS